MMETSSTQIDRTGAWDLIPEHLTESAELVSFGIGERILRAEHFDTHVYCIKSGHVRQLVPSSQNRGPLTLRRLEPGGIFGFENLLVGRPIEWASAATDVELWAIPVTELVPLLKPQGPLVQALLKQRGPCLLWDGLRRWMATQTMPPEDADHLLRHLCDKAELMEFSSGQELDLDPERLYILLSEAVESIPVGSALISGQKPILPLECRWPLVALSIPRAAVQQGWVISEQLGELQLPSAAFASAQPATESSRQGRQIPDAYSLGLRVPEKLSLTQRFPERRGRGNLGEAMALVEMLALSQRVPFRRDQASKRLRVLGAERKPMNLGKLAVIVNQMNLMARPAEVAIRQIRSIETPFLFMQEGRPMLALAIEGNRLVVADGAKGLFHLPLTSIDHDKDRLKLVHVKRHAGTPEAEFNWAWLMPAVGKYKWSLALVLLASLMAQLFTLGIPLLFQQLIDKTLNQGNISSLNIIAGTMVLLAVFQGLMTALRTFLFVDTTDRIDLTLGTAVIDRLLRLPLSFYEKRSVGELSQRLGELNNLRSFLTGTAITAVLDLLFSFLYLVVMLLYSPMLTAVALSTFPLYFLMTVGVSPIYRRQLRTRASAQARTQSHLIEVLGGIQTIKAQHGELRSRWKWQDRYQEFVEQGYRSVVLGTTTSQIGTFLNTVSSLLILWVGLHMVIAGQFTLGQLLAFRIIAGYVTAPLLRLSSLWQGIQTANISMERLGDIVNQAPEGGNSDADMLALPPVKGDVQFDHISFRFGKKGPRQLSNVNINIEAGQFIGVVGISGSGKSTLMKLLARLYEPEEGRVLIDGTDISKVQISSLRSQVGMVPQDSLLFEGTVAENIALNNPEVDSEQIVQAAKVACAHEFIMGLPEGYASRIAERGANLSGGQRQRLAIARMVLESPRLLIMDEATSALDAPTERMVCRNLQELFRDETVFFVTHRLSTVMGADRIIVMDQGTVVEQGSPQELLQSNGLFSAIWSQQS